MEVLRVATSPTSWCRGTMGGVTPVLTVDGRTIGSGSPGPCVHTLSAAYLERTAAEGSVVG